MAKRTTKKTPRADAKPAGAPKGTRPAKPAPGPAPKPRTKPGTKAAGAKKKPQAAKKPKPADRRPLPDATPTGRGVRANRRPTGDVPPRDAAAPSASKPLAQLRDKIDEVDRKLVRLLNDRARLVKRVGQIKRAEGTPIYAPHREQQVIGKVLELSRREGGDLPERTIEAIYRELMSGSFHLEQPLRIGYLGPVGSYSHLGATKHFGASVAYEDLHSIDGVFTEVARGHVDYGLVPIENSLGGGIAETLSAFQDFHEQIRIYTEVQLAVHHALLANGPPGEIRRIYSKPEVFQQCRKWLATQFPKADLVPAASSARAVITAREEAERDAASGVAAIGSVLAGEAYGVHVLFEDIEDDTSNITRFFVISRQETEPSGDDKTSLMFTTPDKPGALAEVLAVFQRAGINLTHIDKRPSGRVSWAYTFFVDAEGHVAEAWLQAALQQVRGICDQLHVLGSYPRSRRIL